MACAADPVLAQVEAGHEAQAVAQGLVVLQLKIVPLGEIGVVVGLCRDGQRRIGWRQGSVEREVVVATQVVVEVLQSQVAMLVDGSLPYDLLEVGTIPEGPQRASLHLAGRQPELIVREAVPVIPLAEGGSEHQGVTHRRPVVDAQIGGANPLAVVAVGKTGVGDLPRRDAVVEIAGAAAMAHMEVLDRALSTADEAAVAQRLGGMVGADVDDGHEGVGPVGSGIGAADDLDTLDVLDIDAEVVPQHPAEGGQIDRPAVDEHLQPGRECPGQAVVADEGEIAVLVRDQKARHQSHQFVDGARAAVADGGLVQHGDGRRRVQDRLQQPGRGLDAGQLGEEQGLVRHLGPRHAGGQQGDDG